MPVKATHILSNSFHFSTGHKSFVFDLKLTVLVAAFLPSDSHCLAADIVSLGFSSTLG